MSKVAVIIASDYEDSELTVPVDMLREEGHEVVLLGVEKGEQLDGKKGEASVVTDGAIADANADEFDALVIPCGYSPDKLRMHEEAVSFVRDFAKLGKPIAAVCHGPQILIEAGLVRERRMTSWPSVKTDLVNAGAKWEDASVVEDGIFITSRKPADLEAFSGALLKRLESMSRASGVSRRA